MKYTIKKITGEVNKKIANAFCLAAAMHKMKVLEENNPCSAYYIELETA